jgi:hypothetical protein
MGMHRPQEEKDEGRARQPINQSRLSYLNPDAYDRHSLRMTNQERTEQYVSYFREQLFSIDRLQTRLHKKILLVIILDSLSRARYPSIQGVKERFVKMVTEAARWEHADRVSLYRVLLSLKAKKVMR